MARTRLLRIRMRMLLPLEAQVRGRALAPAQEAADLQAPPPV